MSRSVMMSGILEELIACNYSTETLEVELHFVSNPRWMKECTIGETLYAPEMVWNFGEFHLRRIGYEIGTSEKVCSPIEAIELIESAMRYQQL